MPTIIPPEQDTSPAAVPGLPTGHQMWVTMAVRAIADFAPDPALGGGSIRTLLSMWRHYGQLTAEQVNEAVSYFTAADPESTQQLGRIPFGEPSSGDLATDPDEPPALPAADPERATVPLERCAAPATVVVEAWNPKDGHAHGSLDESRYACADHVTAVTQAIQSADMTAHRTSGQHPRPGRVCGEVFDYRALGHSEDPLPAYPFQGKPHGAVAINITPGEPATAICAGCAGLLEWRQMEDPQPGEPLGGWVHVDTTGGARA